MAAVAGGGFVHGATKQSVPTRVADRGLAADPTERSDRLRMSIGFGRIGAVYSEFC